MRLTRPPAVQPAYVLHQHDWSESSLILDLFTREQGRLVVVAKGAKRPYSQLRSVLLPFQRLQLPAHSYLEVSAFGGHCGFVEGLSLRLALRHPQAPR